MKKEVLVLVFFVLLGPLFAEIYKAPCIQDGYVSSGAQFQRITWGYAPDLFIGISDAPNYQAFGNLTTYILFDLPFIGNASEVNVHIKRANLTLTPRSIAGNSTYGISFFTCTDTTWNESSLTWEARPSTERLLPPISSAQINEISPINITQLIQSYVNGRRNKLCLGLAAQTGTTILYSRQSSNSSRFPTLSVEFSQGDRPTNFPTIFPTIERPTIFPTIGRPTRPTFTTQSSNPTTVSSTVEQGRPLSLTTLHSSTPHPHQTIDIPIPHREPKKDDETAAVVIPVTIVVIIATLGVIALVIMLIYHTRKVFVEKYKTNVKNRAPPIVELTTIPETEA